MSEETKKPQADEKKKSAKEGETTDPKPLVEAMEEDDEFEEFEPEHWARDQSGGEDEQQQQWMDNWDDDMDDDFTKNLREELQKYESSSGAK